jgi:hypothetical protein
LELYRSLCGLWCNHDSLRVIAVTTARASGDDDELTPRVAARCEVRDYANAFGKALLRACPIDTPAAAR